MVGSICHLIGTNFDNFRPCKPKIHTFSKFFIKNWVYKVKNCQNWCKIALVMILNQFCDLLMDGIKTLQFGYRFDGPFERCFQRGPPIGNDYIQRYFDSLVSFRLCPRQVRPRIHASSWHSNQRPRPVDKRSCRR